MDNKKFILLLSIAGALSGIVALFSYVQNRAKNKLQEEIFGLDKQIKQLELNDRIGKKKFA